MMLKMAQDMQKEYPGTFRFWNTNIDAQMMWLTKNPETYHVIVAGNMFGDIVSDGFAGLIGGLGFACSANIGPEIAVFEPTHGSAQICRLPVHRQPHCHDRIGLYDA